MEPSNDDILRKEILLQEQAIKQLGLDPSEVTEEQVIQKFLESECQPKEEYECNICLSPIEDKPHFPCRCLFFKIHLECLPKNKYTCHRCSQTYGLKHIEQQQQIQLRRNTIYCLAATRNNMRCRKRKRYGDLCTIHHKMAERGCTVFMFSTSFLEV